MQRICMRAVMILTLAICAMASPAYAQFDHTWVASNGNNGNNCDRLTPCADFNNAYSKTNANGEISCVDAGSYGGLNIGKSITINCDGTVGAVTSAGFVVTLSASDVVTIRGLDFDFTGSSPGGGLGVIYVNGTGTLHVQKVRIAHVVGDYNGIKFRPSSSVAQLHVSDSMITDVQVSSGVDAGILIEPFNGTVADVTLTRVNVESNSVGVRVAGGGGLANVTISESVIAGSTAGAGLVVEAPGGSTTVFLDRTKIAHNGTGILTNGGGTVTLLNNSVVTANGTALSIINGGAVFSYGNNAINNNGTPGQATTLIPPR